MNLRSVWRANRSGSLWMSHPRAKVSTLFQPLLPAVTALRAVPMKSSCLYCSSSQLSFTDPSRFYNSDAIDSHCEKLYDNWKDWINSSGPVFDTSWRAWRYAFHEILHSNLLCFMGNFICSCSTWKFAFKTVSGCIPFRCQGAKVQEKSTLWGYQ